MARHARHNARAGRIFVFHSRFLMGTQVEVLLSMLMMMLSVFRFFIQLFLHL
jgi:hypothetical protein